MFKSNQYAYLGLAVVLLLTTVVRLQFIELPFERDEGLYVHLGSLILDGAVPFQDFYDAKPPGLCYLYAATEAVVGQSPMGLHVVFLLINLATTLLIFTLARRTLNTIGGLAAATTFSMLSLHPHAGGLSILSEHLVVLFAVGGLVALNRAIANKQRKHFLLGGLLMGFSLLAKQNGLFFIAAGGLYIVLARWRHFTEPRPAIYFNTLLYLLASLVPTVLIFGILAILGQASEYWYWNFSYQAELLTGVSAEQAFEFFVAIGLKLMEGHWWWWILAFGGLLMPLRDFSKQKPKSLLVALVPLSAMALLPRFTFHGHYFLFVMPAAALLAGAAVASMARIMRNQVPKEVLRTALFGGLMVALGIHTAFNAGTWFQTDNKALIKQIYGNNPFWETYELADWLNEHKQPGDQLLVYGAELQLYCYTEMLAPTRHLWFPYLVDGTAASLERQQEFIKDVETAKPRFIVAVNHPLSIMRQGAPDDPVLVWYGDFTAQHYTLKGVVEMHGAGEADFTFGDDLADKPLLGTHHLFVWERSTD